MEEAGSVLHVIYRRVQKAVQLFVEVRVFPVEKAERKKTTSFADQWRTAGPHCVYKCLCVLPINHPRLLLCCEWLLSFPWFVFTATTWNQAVKWTSGWCSVQLFWRCENTSTDCKWHRIQRLQCCYTIRSMEIDFQELSSLKKRVFRPNYQNSSASKQLSFLGRAWLPHSQSLKMQRILFSSVYMKM